MRIAPAALVPVLWAAQLLAAGGDLTVELPRGMSVSSAVASNSQMKLDTNGAVAEGKITFADLLPDTPYDLRLTLADGTVLQGVDLSWYIPEDPAKPDAGAMTDDDREALRAIVQDIKDFYNKKDILLLRGDHDRAVALTRLVRDSDFHAGNGAVIWRIELWYFKFHYGGWEKIGQENKVLRRERFADAHAYESATAKLKWSPDLGGIRLAKDQPTTTIALPEQK